MLLKDKYKKILTDIFLQVSLPIEVWAYGSRVSGSAHDGSDLDLVIFSSDRRKLPLDTLSEIKDKIRDSNIPILVDLFDWARLSESFQRNIEACHETFFSSSVDVLNEPKIDYEKNKSDNS